jgi:hypothetical protein
VTLLSVKLVEVDLAALWLPSRLGYLAFWPVTRGVLEKFAPSEIRVTRTTHASALDPPRVKPW